MPLKTSLLPELMTTAQAAEFMNVKETTVRAWARAGYIPAYKLGPKLWRFAKKDLLLLKKITV